MSERYLAKGTFVRIERVFLICLKMSGENKFNKNSKCKKEIEEKDISTRKWYKTKESYEKGKQVVSTREKMMNAKDKIVQRLEEKKITQRTLFSSL